MKKKELMKELEITKQEVSERISLCHQMMEAQEREITKMSDKVANLFNLMENLTDSMGCMTKLQRMIQNTVDGIATMQLDLRNMTESLKTITPTIPNPNPIAEWMETKGKTEQ